MEAYQGYFRGGQFYSLEDVAMPENRQVIVTVLDDAVSSAELELCALLKKSLEDTQAGRGTPIDKFAAEFRERTGYEKYL